jgi:hypothetical protein
MDRQILEKNKKILERHGHFSENEALEITKNIAELAKVLLAFENRKKNENNQRK